MVYGRFDCHCKMGAPEQIPLNENRIEAKRKFGVFKWIKSAVKPKKETLTKDGVSDTDLQESTKENISTQLATPSRNTQIQHVFPLQMVTNSKTNQNSMMVKTQQNYVFNGCIDVQIGHKYNEYRDSPRKNRTRSKKMSKTISGV